MKAFSFLLVIGVAYILQVTILSRLPLLYGTADLILLTLASWCLHERVKFSLAWGILCGALIAFISAVPPIVPIISYFIVAFTSRLVLRRVWQAPIIALFVTVFSTTLLLHMISFTAYEVEGAELPLWDSINLVILPSALFNILLSLPVYTLVKDFAQWVYPVEIEL